MPNKDGYQTCKELRRWEKRTKQPHQPIIALSANVLGADLKQLTDYSLRALEVAQRTPSLAEPKLSLNVSNPEIHVAVDRRRAADLGVRMATIGNTLRETETRGACVCPASRKAVR